MLITFMLSLTILKIIMLNMMITLSLFMSMLNKFMLSLIGDGRVREGVHRKKRF